MVRTDLQPTARLRIRCNHDIENQGMNSPNYGWDPTPLPWTAFPSECLWYFVPMSVVYFAVFLIGCIALLVISNRDTGSFKKRIFYFGLFMSLLLLAGSLFNGLWSCMVYNRLYHSADYIFDFCPVWPVTWKTVDTPWGDSPEQFLGTSLFKLNLVWLLFAASTWGVTIFLYRTIRACREGCLERFK